MAFRIALDQTGGELVFGTAGADTIEGGPGNDFLFGGAGPDTFVFHRGDGHDLIYDFHPGEDQLAFPGFSGREISWHDTDLGVEAQFGGLGGQGANHGSVLLLGVHSLGAGDIVLA